MTLTYDQDVERELALEVEASKLWRQAYWHGVKSHGKHNLALEDADSTVKAWNHRLRPWLLNSPTL